MNKYIISFSIIIFIIISCTNNNSESENQSGNDLFSNKKITFQRLDLNEEGIVNNTNSYSITNIGVSFIPPINSVKLPDEEKDSIISQTGYGKDYFPITLEEHINLMRNSGFRVVEILWLSNMQVGLWGMK